MATAVSAAPVSRRRADQSDCEGCDDRGLQRPMPAHRSNSGSADKAFLTASRRPRRGGPASRRGQLSRLYYDRRAPSRAFQTAERPL